MKKFLSCLVMLMSVGQVFAPGFPHPLNVKTTGLQAVEGSIQIKAMNIACTSVGAGVSSDREIIFDDHTKPTIAELLAQVDSPFYYKSACIKIGDSISDEKNRALVTLIRSTIRSSARSSIYTVKAFHDLLFLANYYPSVEEATSAFSSVPKSFLQDTDICSGEIDTRKFTKSLGLVFVISNCKKYPHERVLPVAEVMSTIAEEETKLSEANTIEEALITIAQSNTEDALSSYWIENCNHIASHKTESENRALAQLVKTTMKIHEAFKIDSDSYCSFPQYTVFQFYRYLKVADYYPSISDAEQAFSSAPAQRNLLHVFESAIEMANIRRDIITSDLPHPLTTERTELQASEGLLSQNTASPNLLPLLEIADPIIPNGSPINTNSEEVDTATDPSEKLISVIDELWKLIDVQLQYKRRPFETVEMLIQQKSEK